MKKCKKFTDAEELDQWVSALNRHSKSIIAHLEAAAGMFRIIKNGIVRSHRKALRRRKQ